MAAAAMGALMETAVAMEEAGTVTELEEAAATVAGAAPSTPLSSPPSSSPISTPASSPAAARVADTSAPMSEASSLAEAESRLCAKEASCK